MEGDMYSSGTMILLETTLKLCGGRSFILLSCGEQPLCRTLVGMSNTLGLSGGDGFFVQVRLEVVHVNVDLHLDKTGIIFPWHPDGSGGRRSC